MTSSGTPAVAGFDARGRRFAIAVARFNEEVTVRLEQGARETLARHGVADDDVEVFHCPGAFELPLVARRLAASGLYEAVICLGAVIRGETAHFDFVAGQAAAGIQRAALDTGVPCVLGVLTTESLEQALDRAGGRRGHKGREAAIAAMEMASLLDELPKPE